MAKIIDASVAIKWLILEEGRDSAMALFEEVLSTPDNFSVPELFFFELSHVFNKLVPKPTNEQVRILDHIWICGINRFSMTPELYKEIRRFQRMGLTGYDASYVALAGLLKGTWVTFDRKAHRLVESYHLSQLLT